MIACVLVLAGSAAAQKYTWRQCLDAIRITETGGEPNGGIGAIGDRGKALGPYQIWRAYHTDSKQKGTHRKCLRDKAYSELVVAGYMSRYAKAQYKRLCDGKGTVKDIERIARIHNGGPRGYTRNSTLKYWYKVRRNLIPKPRR